MLPSVSLLIYLLTLILCKSVSILPKLSPFLDVFHHRGQVKLLMEKTDEAISDFQKAVQLNPNFSVAVVQKCYSEYRHAMQSQNVNLLMQSMEDFKDSLKKFPRCPETYILYAQVKAEKQEYQEADELFRKALEVDPDNASIYLHRGLLLLQWKGEIENAVEMMRKAIKIDDKSEFAYETLGTVEVQRFVFFIKMTLMKSRCL